MNLNLMIDHRYVGIVPPFAIKKLGHPNATKKPFSPFPRPLPRKTRGMGAPSWK